jgi:hypothetical protein
VSTTQGEAGVRWACGSLARVEHRGEPTPSACNSFHNVSLFRSGGALLMFCWCGHSSTHVGMYEHIIHICIHMGASDRLHVLVHCSCRFTCCCVLLVCSLALLLACLLACLLICFLVLTCLLCFLAFTLFACLLACLLRLCFAAFDLSSSQLLCSGTIDYSVEMSGVREGPGDAAAFGNWPQSVMEQLFEGPAGRRRQERFPEQLWITIHVFAVPKSRHRKGSPLQIDMQHIHTQNHCCMQLSIISSVS